MDRRHPGARRPGRPTRRSSRRVQGSRSRRRRHRRHPRRRRTAWRTGPRRRQPAVGSRNPGSPRGRTLHDAPALPEDGSRRPVPGRAHVLCQLGRLHVGQHTALPVRPLRRRLRRQRTVPDHPADHARHRDARHLPLHPHGAAPGHPPPLRRRHGARSRPPPPGHRHLLRARDGDPARRRRRRRRPAASGHTAADHLRRRADHERRAQPRHHNPRPSSCPGLWPVRRRLATGCAHAHRPPELAAGRSPHAGSCGRPIPQTELRIRPPPATTPPGAS